MLLQGRKPIAWQSCHIFDDLVQSDGETAPASVAMHPGRWGWGRAHFIQTRGEGRAVLTTDRIDRDLAFIHVVYKYCASTMCRTVQGARDRAEKKTQRFLPFWSFSSNLGTDDKQDRSWLV